MRPSTLNMPVPIVFFFAAADAELGSGQEAAADDAIPD